MCGRLTVWGFVRASGKVNSASTEIAECISSPPCLDDSKEEPSHSKEPLEQLKAELAELRTLVVAQAQWEGMRELLLFDCPQSCLNKVWLVLAKGTAGVTASAT